MTFRHADDPARVIPERIEEVGAEVMSAAFDIHTDLGPGLLERVYAVALDDELSSRGLSVGREVHLPVERRGRRIDAAFRIDLLVEDAVVVEVKSVERLHPVHWIQTATYLRLARKPLGYLLNFNVPKMRDGVRRFVNTTTWASGEEAATPHRVHRVHRD